MSIPRVVIVGSGGHAKVIADILETNAEYAIAGFTSPSPDDALYGYPHLGSDEELPRIFARGIQFAFIAIGSNRIRFRKLEELNETGFRLINAVSNRAVVSARAHLGRGVAIMPGAVINTETIVEDGAVINTGATVDHEGRIGVCAHIAPGAHLAGNVVVGEGSFLGVGSSVIPGIRIGKWVTVGAGGAVIRDIPDGATTVGVPARRFLAGAGPA